MAPIWFEKEDLTDLEFQYRNNTQTRRQNRGLVDHDIFEGLPVRNWRRDIVVVAPPPAHNALNQPADKWDVELPWGMPKDSDLMPQHSRDLLRAARSGRLYQKRPLTEEDQEDDALMADKPEKKEAEPKDDGFTVRTWKLVPKHLEGPEFEYLAKRRKGLRGTAITGAAVPGPIMTKMTVRKTDDQGNSFIEHVVVPEGQAVEGEVIAQTVVTDAAAVPGVAEPLKRRPPPPKRKAKGPGRGRKKKVMLTAPTSAPIDADAALVDGQAVPVPKVEGAVGEDGVKKEATATPSADNEDTEMGDGSQVPSDDEGEEGDDGSDDGSEEGEIIDDEQEHEDEEAKKRAEQERERLIKANNSMEQKLPEKPAIADFTLDTPGGISGQRLSGRDFGGSPLKNTFMPRSYSPSVHDPEAEAEGDEDEDEEPHNGRPSHRNSPFVAQTSRQPSDELQHRPEILPNTATDVGEPTNMQENTEDGFQSMLEGTSPEDMLLDGGNSSQDTVLARPDSGFGMAPEDQGQQMDDGEVREEQTFVDLLGGLEEHLNEHEAAASANSLPESHVPQAQPMSLPEGAPAEVEENQLEDVTINRLTPAPAATGATDVLPPPPPPADKSPSLALQMIEEAPAQVKEPTMDTAVEEKPEDSASVPSPAKEAQPEEVKEGEAVLGGDEAANTRGEEGC